MKKTLKTLFAATLVSCLFIINAKAQTTQTAPVSPWHFGVGLESGITTSGISSKTEIGATARLQYDLSKNFALTLTSGYYEFLSSSTRNAMGLIPVKLGVKAFVGSGFYFSGEAGAGIETQKYNSLKGIDVGTPKTTKLILSPGFGYAVKSLDFSLRYESFVGNNVATYDKNNFALIGLRVGYSF
jgi:hypothetical protein